KFGSKENFRAVEIIAGEGIGYTVPQKIRPGNVSSLSSLSDPASAEGLNAGKGCDVFFRVRSVYENASIEISAKQMTIAKRHKRMSPGEMMRVNIPKEFMDDADSITIKVVPDKVAPDKAVAK
ncbi:MAG: hypothetical protein FWB75_08675, partial [Oscillospiraceae bacterium]|nr:hypothetical protein [Oscillospiraceae bacterium]